MEHNLPAGFAYLDDPRLIYDIAYATSNNFVGRPIAGYNKHVCIASNNVIAAIKSVQDNLDVLNNGLVLKVFDSYRPQTAVDDFVKWSQDLQDNKKQQTHYPNISKADLFKLKYLNLKSRHSTGTAIDITLAKRDNKNSQQHQELDMGTIFDFFDETSHTDSTAISTQAQLNRQMLKILMERHGFKNYHYEWWHYNIIDEQFTDTYFDFSVE